MSEIRIVFESISFGEWVDGKDGFWYLVIPDHAAALSVARACPICSGDGQTTREKSCACGGTGKWYDCYLYMQNTIYAAEQKIVEIDKENGDLKGKLSAARQEIEELKESVESWKKEWRLMEAAEKMAEKEVEGLNSKLFAVEKSHCLVNIAFEKAEAERDEAVRLHNELIMQVENKVPGLSRHEACLRLIKNCIWQGKQGSETQQNTGITILDAGREPAVKKPA